MSAGSPPAAPGSPDRRRSLATNTPRATSISNHRPLGLTDGYLPEAAFLHLEPTAIGFVDLDQALTVRYPAETSAGACCRDALLMVRLHDEPLAIVYVSEPLDSLAPHDLASVIWIQARDAIQSHAERYGCIPSPRESGQLIPGLGPGAADCPGARPANADVAVTVIVPTGGRPAKLERCLRSLSSLSFDRFDVVVVDNRPQIAGTSAVVDAVSDRLRVRYVAEPRPGSAVARNRGLAEAESSFVAFADDDVVVDRNWLSWLMDPFADAAVSAVAGMILPLELSTEAQKRLEQYAGFSKGVVGRRYDLGLHRARERVLYPYWGGMFGSGASMAFRRAELAAAGGLDPALGAGSPARAGADIEVFTATILRGGQVVYQPRAVCWHEHTRDDTALRRLLFNYGVGFSAIMTKYLTHDPRFLGAFARSIPLALEFRRGNGPGRRTLPRELARAERQGMLCGPWLYARSRRWAKRLRLADVVRGS
jgi:glycosyltransferase involved in cell wall biosynthesis